MSIKYIVRQKEQPKEPTKHFVDLTLEERSDGAVTLTAGIGSMTRTYATFYPNGNVKVTDSNGYHVYSISIGKALRLER